MKKAQSISINTIIVAAIALIVLVVLVAIFTGRLGDFNLGLFKISGDLKKDCTEIDASYTVRALDECNALEGAQHVRSKDAPGTTEFVCCTK
ncbi:hypothetical protein HY638_00265 [Candidatus Woesearchaeota archaeon]|nr:hypothetical protein [Candidatus Woesearchaeota archaeon]